VHIDCVRSNVKANNGGHIEELHDNYPLNLLKPSGNFT
jgi:hypothetical protein